MTTRQQIENEICKVEDNLKMSLECRRVDIDDNYDFDVHDMNMTINAEILKLAVRRKALRDVLVMIDFGS